MRLATLVVEQVLEPIDQSPALGERLELSTSLAPVTLRVGAVTPTPSPAVFSIRSRTGGTLVDAEVAPGSLAEARARWRRGISAAVLAVVGVTLLLGAGVLVDVRRHARSPRINLGASVAIVAALVLSRSVLLLSTTQVEMAQALAGPLDLFLAGLLAAAVVCLAVDLIEGRRLARPRARLLAPDAGAFVAAVYLGAGVLDAVLLWGMPDSSSPRSI